MIHWLEKKIRKVYYFLVTVFWHKELEKNIELKDKYNGEECFIFMTGPIVNELDLSIFKNKKCFICNHFYRAESVSEMDPTFYSHLENANRTMKAEDESEKSISLVSMADSMCPNADFLLHITAKKYMRKIKFTKERKIYYIGTRKSEINENMKIDYTKLSPFTKGSVYFLITIALYMGFKKIYLIGAGYTLEPYQWFHFYEPYDSLEYKKRVENIRNQKPEKEHFVMKKISEKYNAQIINVIPDGYKSPIYNSIKLNEFIEMVEGI